MNSYAPVKTRSIFILYPKNLIYPLSKTFILSFPKVFYIWNKSEPHRHCDASLCFSGLCGAHAGRTAALQTLKPELGIAGGRHGVPPPMALKPGL